MKIDQSKIADEVSALLQRILFAFNGVPRPRITHRVARGADDEWVLSPERVRELAALDPERSWTDVSDEAIECFQEYFTFSAAEGWRFYLPAHMRYYLQRFPDCRYDAVYWACVSREHFDLLTSEQRECADAFLGLIHAHQLSSDDRDA